METRKPIKAIAVEKSIPTGPTNRFMENGGREPPVVAIMGFFITSGIKLIETTKLKSVAIGGINLAIFLEMSPKMGMKNAKIRGTTINNMGFIFI